MNDDGPGGAELRRFFKFVCPPAVVGHGRAAECFGIEFGGIGGIGHGRIVDEDDENFALYVHALEIVPLKFRGLHAVAHENHVRIDRGSFRDAF